MDLQAPDLDQMRLFIYRRPLHPELFTIYLDKSIDTGRYEAKLWIIGTGHVISFHADNSSVVEILTSRYDLLPDKGLLEEIRVDRSREYQTCYDGRIYYMMTMQSEHMPDAVFASVHEEMARFAKDRGLFIPFDHWAQEGEMSPFSFIDYERRPAELDIFTYHSFPSRKVMLRMQSVFSLEPIDSGLHPMPGGPFGGSTS